MISRRTLIAGLLFLTLASSFSGCLRTKTAAPQAANQPITLVFYGLFDPEEVWAPLIQSYENTHPGVNIVYKNFTDPSAYMDLIINELAEGEGPDLFMMHNTWFTEHYKKLTPAPESLVNPEVFRDLFLEVTGKDLVLPDATGKEQVWGLPIYVDTLALFYNKDHLEEAVPERGKPGATWEELQADVQALTREDQSFSRFERSGLALGRTDNILRGFDTLMMLFLQHKISFYDAEGKQVILDKNPQAASALELFSSFAQKNNQNYTWSATAADPKSAEKELTAFASGKLSMLFGFSYTYQDILQEIARLNRQNKKTIDPKNIRIQEVPQVFDPKTSADTREAYASYFVPVVSRTTSHPQEAWEFLISLSDPAQMKSYHESTNKTSALRSLLSEQKIDPIYGAFALQAGYADSIPMPDADKVQTLFTEVIQANLEKEDAGALLKEAAQKLQALIPTNGIPGLVRQ